MYRLVAGACLVLALSGCAQPSEWESPLSRDHPLVGHIWQPSTGQFVSRAEVERALAAADFVLLGERHDNPDHHTLQADLVAAMTAAGRRPAIVFEMITEDQQPNIKRWRAANPPNAAGLGPAVGWEKSGWPAWPTYQPIADAAVAAALNVRAGNLPRALMSEIHKQGITAIEDGRRTRLGLDEPLSEAARDAMLDTLFQAHCELMPREALTPLVAIQRARDAIMADNMVLGAGAPGADGAVLITGAGHARADSGVPTYLQRLAPQRSIATVAFVQVADSKTDPAAYATVFDGALPFDFLWFTPRIDDRDHCAELEERMRKR